MAGAKILAIFQSGGEFVRNADGSMSYSGGEAHALYVNQEMKIQDLKKEICNMFRIKNEDFSIKYFLPKNKKTLITISSDRDVERMVDFHATSDTTDIYVLDSRSNWAEKRKSRSFIVDSARNDADNDTIIADNSTIADLEEATPQSLCNDWSNFFTGVGQAFDDARAFRDALHKYAIANSFTYKFIKNDLSRITAECHTKGCPWRIHASKIAFKEDLVIRTFNKMHTCLRENGKISRRWIASVIKNRLRESPNYTPKDIAGDLRRDYGIKLSYAQAWQGKSIANKELCNTQKEAFAPLPWFCQRIIETNPGSMATLETHDDSNFRLFIAFHASLGGFENGCSPLLFLDGITLTVNRHWKLLVVSAVDGENDVFPIAMSVVGFETRENWHWVLEQLKSALSLPRTLTFISNWQNSLEEVVLEVFEDSFHGFCTEQLIKEFKAQFKDSWTEELKKVLVEDIKRCICACKVDDFNEAVKSIKAQSAELGKWVLSSKPERWSDAFFNSTRCCHYTSNAIEVLKDWVSTRKEPTLLQMVDMIRCQMMEMMFTRRESSNSWTEILIPSAHLKVQEERIKAQELSVTCLSSSIFEVHDDTTEIVNIEDYYCTCRRWRVTGLPCVHALAVFEQKDQCIYDYCSEYLTTKSYRTVYSLPINPIPDVYREVRSENGSISDRGSSRAHRKKTGHPKEKLHNPRIAALRSVRCSKCNGYGHNKKTCKTPA